jgi:hypothetical protein
MFPDDHAPQSLVLGLTSQRMYRDLFWRLAAIGPLLLLGIAVLLARPRRRRAAAAALLVSLGGAIAFALVFHATYAMAICRGHDSAVRYLDEVALWAGFAASAVAWACGYAICAGVRRVVR